MQLPSSIQQLWARLPRAALLRFALLGGLLLAGVAIVLFTPAGQYFERERMIAALETLQHVWWAPLLLIGLYAVSAPLGLPMSPFMYGGGVVFGALWGWTYNTVGLFLGAALSYQAAKLLGRDLVVHLAGKQLRRAERLFERRGFWPLVQVRFLPLPFAVVNYGAALAGVKQPLFLLSTAIGLAPATLMHTYYASSLYRASSDRRLGVLAQYLVVWGIFAVVTGLPTLREQVRRRRRYRELRGRRRERVGG